MPVVRLLLPEGVVLLPRLLCSHGVGHDSWYMVHWYRHSEPCALLWLLRLQLLWLRRRLLWLLRLLCSPVVSSNSWQSELRYRQLPVYTLWLRLVLLLLQLLWVMLLRLRPRLQLWLLLLLLLLLGEMLSQLRLQELWLQLWLLLWLLLWLMCSPALRAHPWEPEVRHRQSSVCTLRLRLRLLWLLLSLLPLLRLLLLRLQPRLLMCSRRYWQLNRARLLLLLRWRHLRSTRCRQLWLRLRCFSWLFLDYYPCPLLMPVLLPRLLACLFASRSLLHRRRRRLPLLRSGYVSRHSRYSDLPDRQLDGAALLLGGLRLTRDQLRLLMLLQLV